MDKYKEKIIEGAVIGVSIALTILARDAIHAMASKFVEDRIDMYDRKNRTKY